MQNLKYLEIASELKKENKPFVIITLTDTKGSAPQDVGAKAIVTNDGLAFGTVGGGKIENHCINYAFDLLKKEEISKPGFYESWNLQTEIGMTCGGVASFYFEIFRPEKVWNIAVFGAGHVSQALCRTLMTLDCQLTCIDTREEWLSKFPSKNNFKTILSENPKSELKKLNEDTFVVLMTKGHSTDLPVLAEALQYHNFPYLGAIGSEAKANSLKKGLQEHDLPMKRLQNFICPIGMPIGNNTPEEISISITAQLLKIRDQFFSTPKRSS